MSEPNANATLQLGLTLLDAAIKYGLPAVTKLIEIAHSPEPSKDDWIAMLSAISKEAYEDFIAAARARAGVTP